VLLKKNDEFHHLPELEITGVTSNTTNPFHGVLQSSKSKVLIYAKKSSPNISLSISIIGKHNKSIDFSTNHKNQRHEHVQE